LSFDARRNYYEKYINVHRLRPGRASRPLLTLFEQESAVDPV
jgi:hypothetical protein